MARQQNDIEIGRQRLIDNVEMLVKERGAIEISLADLAVKSGMAVSNAQRFFENTEELMEAMAERWFAGKIRVMEDVVAQDLPSREKMYLFFARRFVQMRDQIESDPLLFQSYLELGRQHFDVVKSYIDLADHYLAIIVAEAMDEGFFEGLSIDDAVSLINQMINPYCNLDIILNMGENLSEENLRLINDTIFAGLAAHPEKPKQPDMHLVS